MLRIDKLSYTSMDVMITWIVKFVVIHFICRIPYML